MTTIGSYEVTIKLPMLRLSVDQSIFYHRVFKKLAATEKFSTLVQVYNFSIPDLPTALVKVPSISEIILIEICI